MAADSQTDPQTPWVRRLAATAEPERAGLLEALVIGEFRAVLLLSPTQELPYDESYFEQGLTSLGATEIEQRLEATLGRAVDAANLLNNPTITHLMAHLRTEVLGDFFTVPQQSAQPSTVGPDTSAVARSLVEDLLKNMYTR